MTEGHDPILDEEQLAAGLTIEGQLDKRFDELFRQTWNSRIKAFVMQMINEKVAEEAMKLGKQLGELTSKRGDL